MKIKYKDWQPTRKSSALVKAANEMVEEYKTMDLTMTLRQMYYRFVAKGVIENTPQSYKTLVGIMTNARLSGRLSWYGIEDRNRTRNSFWFQEDDQQIMDDLSRYIRFDQWKRQRNYVEVWVEKEALGGVIDQACSGILVPNMACKGYLSASQAWRAGRRFKRKNEEGKSCHIIHLGDHDPSGIDMTRDNDDRANMFSSYTGVKVHRIALNMPQIEEFNPPPNPAKLTDSRSSEYVRKYGSESWELDALEPTTLINLIKDKVETFIDRSVWNDVRAKEQHVEKLLDHVGNKWADEWRDQLEEELLNEE